MQCPRWLRDTIGVLPFGMHVDGRTRVHVLHCLDSVFDVPRTEADLPGVRLLVDTERDHERIVWYFARNMIRHARRSPLFAVMSRLLPKRDGAFVDVGANLGMYSYLARTLGAATLLVEPEPRHHAFLSRNESVFGPVFPYALSDNCARGRFFIGDLCHSGASSLVQTDGGAERSPYGSEVQVECVTFDELMGRAGLGDDRIALIKIDVEGHEREVICGMNDYLGRVDSAPIWCEVRGPESDRGGNTCQPIVDYLSAFGYRPFRLRDGRCVQFDPGSAQALPRVFDLLFLKSVDDAWLLSSA